MSESFWLRTKRSPDGCLLWTGSIARDGYGKWMGGPAHRAAYRLAGREIPEGLELDHLCQVRNCVEPTHLEPVTRRENIMRSNNFAAQNARKTHCAHGHPYDEVNTVRYHGYRYCKTCIRSNRRKAKAQTTQHHPSKEQSR